MVCHTEEEVVYLLLLLNKKLAMSNVKNTFSIKDLENLTGIKAHTLRIWEQRYGVLVPERTETKIRTYTDEELVYLLNIRMLIDHGMKISRLSELRPYAELKILIMLPSFVSNYILL